MAKYTLKQLERKVEINDKQIELLSKEIGLLDKKLNNLSDYVFRRT